MTNVFNAPNSWLTSKQLNTDFEERFPIEEVKEWYTIVLDVKNSGNYAHFLLPGFVFEEIEAERERCTRWTMASDVERCPSAPYRHYKEIHENETDSKILQYLLKLLITY